MQQLLQYTSTSMKVSPCLSGWADSLMAPLFALVRWVHHILPRSTVLPLQPSIQSQETASECPEGRKGAVSDNIIHAQWETHRVRLLRSRCLQCWVACCKSVRLKPWLLWLNKIARWERTSPPRKNQTLISCQEEWQRVCECMCVRDKGQIPNHVLPYYFFSPLTTCLSVCVL